MRCCDDKKILEGISSMLHGERAFFFAPDGYLPAVSFSSLVKLSGFDINSQMSKIKPVHQKESQNRSKNEQTINAFENGNH